MSLRTAAQTTIAEPSETSARPTNLPQTLPSTAALNEAIQAYAAGDLSDRPALTRALGYALLTSPRGEVARALPELTSALYGDGTNTTEADGAIEGSVLRDLVKGDPSMLSSVARRGPESFRKALKSIQKAREPPEEGDANGRAEVLRNPLSSFLSTVPIPALLSAVCDNPTQPENDASADSILSLGTPGVKTLLRNLLKPLSASQRAPAVRVLLHHLHTSLVSDTTLETLNSSVETLFGLLRQAVFTPPQQAVFKPPVTRNLSTAQPKMGAHPLFDPALAVDALQHPVMSARFLRQHDVTGAREIHLEEDAQIADFVRDLLAAARSGIVGSGATGGFAESDPSVRGELGAGLSANSREALERACSPYVERAVVFLKRRLKRNEIHEVSGASNTLIAFVDVATLAKQSASFYRFFLNLGRHY